MATTGTTQHGRAGGALRRPHDHSSQLSPLGLGLRYAAMFVSAGLAVALLVMNALR